MSRSKAFSLLKHSKLNFIGNVEGRDVLTGKVDVVVCDGFVGNILLNLAKVFLHSQIQVCEFCRTELSEKARCAHRRQWHAVRL